MLTAILALAIVSISACCREDVNIPQSAGTPLQDVRSSPLMTGAFAVEVVEPVFQIAAISSCAEARRHQAVYGIAICCAFCQSRVCQPRYEPKVAIPLDERRPLASAALHPSPCFFRVRCGLFVGDDAAERCRNRQRHKPDAIELALAPRPQNASGADEAIE